MSKVTQMQARQHAELLIVKYADKALEKAMWKRSDATFLVNGDWAFWDAVVQEITARIV